jgi:hypothetical protein
MTKIKACDMRLGDVISTFDGPFNTSIVASVTADMVRLERPYMRADNFSYGGAGTGENVICLTGVETFALWRSSDAEYTVWQRGVVK